MFNYITDFPSSIDLRPPSNPQFIIPPQDAPVAEFLYQLTKMLTDDNSSIIEWTNGRIVVHDPPRLASDVLNKYFRHSKFSSFQRQLNYFGFRKLAGKGKMSPCSYVNDAITLDIRSLMAIKRKTCRNLGPSEGSEDSFSTSELKRKAEDVLQIDLLQERECGISSKKSQAISSASIVSMSASDGSESDGCSSIASSKDISSNNYMPPIPYPIAVSTCGLYKLVPLGSSPTTTIEGNNNISFDAAEFCNDLNDTIRTFSGNNIELKDSNKIINNSIPLPSSDEEKTILDEFFNHASFTTVENNLTVCTLPWSLEPTPISEMFSNLT